MPDVVHRGGKCGKNGDRTNNKNFRFNNTKNYCCEKNDFLSKDISNLNNSFFKHYLRIESYNFMQKFSRRACVVYFKNMFEFLNHSKFSKGCVARSLCPIFMVDPSNDSSR